MEAAYREELKKRWSIKDFSYRDEHKPGDFCIFVTADALPGRGIECDAHFDSALDFLAWLRYCRIPNLISWNCTNDDDYTIEDDAFLSMCSGPFLDDVTGLLSLLDTAIDAEDPTLKVAEVTKMLNRVFGPGSPPYEINAAGPDLLAFLSEPFLRRKLDALVEGGEDESGDRARLRRLIDTSSFDERKEEDTRLARGFLENCRRL